MSRNNHEDDIKKEPKESLANDSSTQTDCFKCAECSQIRQVIIWPLWWTCKSFLDLMKCKRAHHMADKESATSTGNLMLEKHECFYCSKMLKSKKWTFTAGLPMKHFSVISFAIYAKLNVKIELILASTSLISIAHLVQSQCQQFTKEE